VRQARAKNARILQSHMERCAQDYTIPEIKTVRPRMVIVLGRSAFDAICTAAGQPHVDWSKAGVPPARPRIGSIEIYGVPYPGQLGTNNAGGEAAVDRMWHGLAKRFQVLCRKWY